MEPVSVHRDVTAPPERVFALVSDITRMGEWSPEATGGVWKDAGGPAPGARFVGRNRRGKRSWSTSCTVHAYEPPRRFGFSVTSGPLSVAAWDYTIEPTASGCRVTETWTDRRGALVRIGGRLLTGVEDRASHNRAGMEATLAALAAIAEVADGADT